MEPWMSWVTALTVAGAGYWYYNHQSKAASNKTRKASISTPVQPQQTKAPRRRDEVKPRRKGEAVSASDVSGSDAPVATGASVTNKTEPSKKRKSGKTAAKTTGSAAAAAPPVIVNNDNDDAEAAEEEDNRMWAQQLAQARKGTTLAPPSQANSRSKTVKQSSAKSAPVASSASSNGAEADDDLSPAMSPSLGAGDVSDMLEAPTPGPSTLRLTAPANPQRPRQPKQQSSFQEAETKKQRQNRKKKEDARLEREAEEKERQALAERQRRTAREARGEPARNGMASAKPPANSAWAAQIVNRVLDAPTEAVSNNNGPLLDTFDHDGESTASSNGPLANSTATTSTATTYDVASEEDQMNMAKNLSNDESGWNTVPKGRKQKKSTAQTTDGSDTGSVQNIAFERPAPATKAPAPAPAPKSSINGFAHLNGLSGVDAGSHPEDSEWGA